MQHCSEIIQLNRAPADRAPDLGPSGRRARGALFAPKSVALIGATETVGSVGRAVLENLRAFSGPVYPVNPKHGRVLGVKAYPSIAAVPERVDLAVIVTPVATVPGIISECAEAGARAAVIISAGFKECGADGAALEGAILAGRGGMRIVGPNCLGLMIPALGFNATFATTRARPGSVAFLSQSGALCTAILDWSLRENVGFSAFVSLGSMLDVGWGDLIDHLGDDPRTKSIVSYMESVGDARAFLSAARAVAFTKPIIVIKVGHTGAAARAAASHTGALTGSDAALDTTLPAEWSHGNPVDILGAADAGLYARSVEFALRDPNADGVLVVLTPQAMTDADGTAMQVAASAPKPVLASWMGGASLDDARATLNAAGIPTYDYPDEAARAFALRWSYSDRQRLLYERPALRRDEDAEGRRTAARMAAAAPA